MPRGPCRSVDQMPGAVFSRIAHKVAALPPEQVYPLHVGDTWMEPFAGARMEDFTVAAHPGMHRYSSPQGLPALVDAVIERTRGLGFGTERGGVLVTAGCTGALGAALGSILEPGEEVLILAPFWPLIRGIVQAFRGTPVEVPFYDRVDSVESAVEAVRERITDKTVALYVSTPSNPTGRILPGSWLEGLVELAREHDLWLLSDEVYELYSWGAPHTYVGALAPERTFSAFSFSKGHGMAGNRTGYLVAPSAAIAHARKVSTHTFYAAPTAGQLAGLEVLRHGDAWVDAARESYRKAGEDMADTLGVRRPDGSTFLFLDVAHRLDERGIWGFLEDCLDDGLVLAPGPSFGSAYGTHVRICFTSAPPARVAEAAELLKSRVS